MNDKQPSWIVQFFSEGVGEDNAFKMSLGETKEWWN